MVLWYIKYLFRLLTKPDQFIAIELPIFLAAKQESVSHDQGPTSGNATELHKLEGRHSMAVQSLNGTTVCDNQWLQDVATAR
jgi:hypothetical protein